MPVFFESVPAGAPPIFSRPDHAGPIAAVQGSWDVTLCLPAHGER